MGIQGADGAFAEALVVPVTNLHAVPETVSDEDAASVSIVLVTSAFSDAFCKARCHRRHRAFFVSQQIGMGW